MFGWHVSKSRIFTKNWVKDNPFQIKESRAAYYCVLFHRGETCSNPLLDIFLFYQKETDWPLK